ncbi:MAG: putative manganese-dependent inorganic diphosphatase [Candidatus Njordarchaeales archaeon]
MRILVVGHKNPDTDAIVAAISLTHILRKKGFDAEPFRAGDIQPETRIILEKTRLLLPDLLIDVYSRVKDVMTRNVLYVKEGDPLKKAVNLIVSKAIRSLPIVNGERIVTGLFSTESLAKGILSEISTESLEIKDTPVRNFLEVSSGKLLSGDPQTVLRGKVFVGVTGDKSFIRDLERLKDRIIVIGKREKILLKAIEEGVRVIIVTDNEKIPQEIVSKARERNVTLIVSPHDAYTTLRLLDLSQPIERFSEETVTVDEDTLVKDAREIMLRRGVRSIIVTDETGRLRGIITRSDLVKDYRKKVALVDHNEFSQSVEGIEEAEIVAVIDHHRISGDVKTLNPIIFRVEPLGSTNTIIWEIAKEWGITIDKNIAEAMLYAILSDTLLLKSPTTTTTDKEAVNELCEYVGVDLGDVMEFVRIAIAANEPSDPWKIVTMDLKIFSSEAGNFGIAQIMTTRPENYLKMADSLKKVMSEVLKEKNLLFLSLMITDYIENRTFLLTVGDEDIIANALQVDVSKGYVELPGITSRKSQVLPKILRYLQQR